MANLRRIKNNILNRDWSSKSMKTNIDYIKRQLKQLLEVASKDNWYLEILLALFCGLRKGEILGLKFSDFDCQFLHLI